MGCDILGLLGWSYGISVNFSNGISMALHCTACVGDDVAWYVEKILIQCSEV